MSEIPEKAKMMLDFIELPAPDFPAKIITLMTVSPPREEIVISDLSCPFVYQKITWLFSDGTQKYYRHFLDLDLNSSADDECFITPGFYDVVPRVSKVACEANQPEKVKLTERK